jgi:predicted nucleic acid-binding Zn ribbon protein
VGVVLVRRRTRVRFFRLVVMGVGILLVLMMVLSALPSPF